MCLIIFTDNIAKTKLRREVLERGFTRNDDGAGFAYIEDGMVRLSKAYFDFDGFWGALRPVLDRIKAGPLLIHFRWATCGSANETNTQPVTIYRNRLVMAHNGVFSGLSLRTKEDISDSVRLAKMINGMEWDFPFSGNKAMMLKAICGGSSKLVFLSGTGKHLIINEQLGKWKDGAWYSDGGSVCIDFAGWYTKHEKKQQRGRKTRIVGPLPLSLRPGQKLTAAEIRDLEETMRHGIQDSPSDDDVDEDTWQRRRELEAARRFMHPNWVDGEGYDEAYQLGPRPGALGD